MFRNHLHRIILAAFFCHVGLHVSTAQEETENTVKSEAIELGVLSSGTRVSAATTGPQGLWGLQIATSGPGSLRQDAPAQISLYDASGKVSDHAAGYQTFEKTPAGFVGRAAVPALPNVKFEVTDAWSITNDTLQVHRQLIVNGTSDLSFASSILFETVEKPALGDIKYFAPGAMYGATEHVADQAAGGIENYQAGALEIREDMFPAPIFGLYYSGGSSVAVLSPEPRGDSVMADFDQPRQMQIDERFLFGAFGAGDLDAGGVKFGYWFPGTRGYLNEDHLNSPTQAVHRRYHPVKDGLTQEYKLAFRFGEDESFHDFYKHAWRWAWATMNPKTYHHDIDQVRRSLIDMMAEQVETHDGRSGLPNSINMKNNPRTRDPKAVMGFTGKNLEAAVFFIMDAARGESPLDAEHRQKGLDIINSFLKLEVAPPEGEGFDMETGKIMLALPHDEVVYLRSFTDDMKILLRGYEFEKAQGHDHPEWLAWCKRFGDWLLTQQQPSGGFPRAWEPGTGKVAEPAPQSSYNAVPLLVQLTQLTGEPQYLEAALLAAEFCWTMEHANDHYVGGTIDNPNIIDKEAGTLSTEAYLALYEHIREQRWLDRAAHAADFAETYIYTWNVPMPVDAESEDLHWVEGVPTIGLNVVSTSRPGLADLYLAFDVDEFAKLYKFTGDQHYLDIATMLLHNSNNMLALPGRLLNLPGPGWTCEHIALGPPHRGRGLNHLWLPWVNTCRLNGILYTEELDPELFEQMKAAGE